VKLWEARVDNEVVNARADGDQTLVPLPARLNPNDPVSVALRLGQAANGSGTSVTLAAPRTAAPTVINEWTVRADSGRVLVPRGGNAELVSPALTESGLEWISGRSRFSAFFLLGFAALGAVFLRARSGWRVPLGLVACINVTIGALLLAAQALMLQRQNLRELTYAATMVPAGENVAMQLANVGEWRALLVGWGVALAVVGAGLLLALRLPAVRERWYSGLLLPVGIVLLTLGLLAQRGGAVLFYAGVGLAVYFMMFIPGANRWYRARRAKNQPPPIAPGSGPATVVSLLALIGVAGLTFGSAPTVRAEGEPSPWLQDGVRAAQSIVQTWTIRDDRLFAELEIAVRGGPADSFLLLRSPAVLTEFKGDGLRLSKVERGDDVVYFVVPERDGLLTARARFERPLPDRTRGLPLPTGPAATQRVTLELDQGGWEFTSPAAVQVLPTPGLGEGRSGATLVLAPHAAAEIHLQPKGRDPTAEATQFFAEAANLYVPGPGVVNGLTRVTVRPVQGRVTALELEVPAGLTVGDVRNGPIGTWRFDPQKRRLLLAVEPAQTETFRFDVETQLGTGALPFDLALEPLRILGAAGEVGTLALGFGGDAQPESVRPTGLSPVNVQDFDATLLPQSREGQALAALQQVWRYGQAGGRVELKVAPVAPEVRLASRQVLSLDDDRLVMAVDLNVAITRVGLFKLSFALPAGLEVEALSGPALSQWTEAQEGAQRIVTLHLNGRTIGDQSFALTLAGAAPHAQDGWSVPRLLVREATRQTGEVLLVPGKGLRLRAVEREKVTQLDPRSVGGLQPGTLAFRLLQDDWVLRVGIEALEPWTTVSALQEVTLREGQTLTRIALRYRVENAAVKHFRVRLPGLSEERARTVRATGSAVSDMVKLPGEADVWEIRFQRGIAGETDVQIEFQGLAAREQGQEPIATPEFVGARQVVQFVAVRGGGRLELDTGTPPRGWTRTDWSAVPANLQSRSDRTVPAFCFRVAEPEGALGVNVRRHDVAEALKLRVTQGELTTLFSPTGGAEGRCARKEHPPRSPAQGRPAVQHVRQWRERRRGARGGCVPLPCGDQHRRRPLGRRAARL